jgi:predicted nucleotidyltransferase
MFKDLQSDQALICFVRSIRELLGPRLKRLVLFGSRSRGEASGDSDYDVLVVVDTATNDITRAIDEVAGDLILRFGAVFSTFPISDETLKQRRFNPFLINVQREGISL